MTNNLDNQLAVALERCEIALPADQVAQLDRYCQLLWSWNERLNLTRHTDYDKFATRDIVDSLALARHIGEGQRVLDVGTGGGVPGVILAVARPDLKMTACESVRKKFEATRAIVDELSASIEIVHARAEELLEVWSYDTLVARAVAPLAKLLYWLDPYWDAMGQLLVIKGRRWVEERREAKEKGLFRRLQLRRLETYLTPGTWQESVVLRLWRDEKEDDA